MATKSLVTGGAGFIGSHLVDKLISLGHEVDIVDNFSTGLDENVNPKARVISNGLGVVLHNCMVDIGSYDFIFHLSGNASVVKSVGRPLLDFDYNARATLLLLEEIVNKRGPHLIYASTGAVYGNPAIVPIREQDPTVPISPYGVSKLASERMAYVYSQIYRIPVTIARLFSVYGPRQRKQVIYDIASSLVRNPYGLSLRGDGEQIRDFLYVDDAVEALIHLAMHDWGKGEVYNVASGISKTINEVADRIAGELHAEPKVSYFRDIYPGDPRAWVVRTTKINELGFFPRYSFDEGIIRTVNWIANDVYDEVEEE